MKKINIGTFATDGEINKLDGEKTYVVSLTTRPAFSGYVDKWRKDGTYSKAWNLIADTMDKLLMNLECAIDDNYLRIFFETQKELTAINTVIRLLNNQIDACFLNNQ